MIYIALEDIKALQYVVFVKDEVRLWRHIRSQFPESIALEDIKKGEKCCWRVKAKYIGGIVVYREQPNLEEPWAI